MPQNVLKCLWGQGFAPTLLAAGGAYSAPPDRLAGFGDRFAARSGTWKGEEEEDKGCTTHKGKGKGKGLDTSYSATYMSQTCDQQRFTISEVAADWHEPVVLQRIMWPSIARANGQLDPRCS